MAHIDRLTSQRYAYKAFNDVAELIDAGKYVPATLSLWAYSAHACDHDAFKREIKRGGKIPHILAKKVADYSEAVTQNVCNVSTRPSAHPVWGTALSLRYLIGLGSDESSFTSTINQSYIDLLKNVHSEMRNIGINALIPAENDEPLIFVPHAKIVHTQNRPSFRTDNDSRALLLAYALHKGIVHEGDDMYLNFPLRIRNRVKDINVKALLDSYGSDIDLINLDYNTYVNGPRQESRLNLDL